jgi:hypothetical protein
VKFMADIGAKLGMKVLTIAIGIPIGIAMRKLVEKVWVAAGPDRPRRAEDEGVQWADAIAWAALTGVGMAIADLATRKGAEEVYRTVLGSKPPTSAKPKASKKVAKAEPEFPESVAPPS